MTRSGGLLDGRYRGVPVAFGLLAPAFALVAVTGCPWPPAEHTPGPSGDGGATAVSGAQAPSGSPAPLPGAGPAGTAQPTPAPAPVVVSGQVAVGDRILPLADQFASVGEVLGSPLSPLDQAPFRRSRASEVVRVDSQPLTDVVPYRILSRWALAGAEQVFVVEVVNPRTGVRIGRTNAGPDGRYRVEIPGGGATAVVVQASGISHNYVSAFLAAPVLLVPSGDTVADVAPGSTMLALSLALLAGVREELRTDTGFRGFRSSELADLLALQDRQAMLQAAGAIDFGRTLLRGGSVSALLTLAARDAGVMAREIVSTAKKAGTTLDTVAASQRLIASGLPGALAVKPEVAEAIVSTAEKVRAEDILAEASSVRTLAGDRVSQLDIVYGQGLRSGYLGRDWHAPAVTGISVLAGPSDAPLAGYVDGPASSARFKSPTGVAIAPDGAVYVSDSRNYRIRRIRNGVVETVAGDGVQRIQDGTGTGASFHSPFALATDLGGNLVIAEDSRSLLRRLATDGSVRTFAGASGPGWADGEASMARFSAPSGLAVDLDGRLLVADTRNHRIRQLDKQDRTSTLAGGTLGSADGLALEAGFNGPLGVAVDAEGTVYVADTENCRVRAVIPGGRVVTLAGDGRPERRDGYGPGASFVFPRYIVSDRDGTLFVADSTWLRVVSPDGTASTLLGGMGGIMPAGKLVAAPFAFEPAAMALAPDGRLIVADATNHRVLALTLSR